MGRVLKPFRDLLDAIPAALVGVMPLGVVAAPLPAEEDPAEQGSASGVTVTDSGNRVIYSPRYFTRYSVISARDMLERIPGIQGLLNGGGDQRGFGNSGDQVLINGKRLSGKSIDIGSTVGRIQARQVERIEVIRGTVEGLDVRSRGRVVNVVLGEALVTGFGSWEASWSHYSDGRTAPGGEVNYSAQAGGLGYVLSAEADRRLGHDTGTDRLFAADGVLFERQVEVDAFESDEYAFTANTTYSFDNGDVLNLNGLYAEERESEQRLSDRFDVTPLEEAFVQSFRIGSEDERKEWELGGDYERVLGNGNVVTGIFVLTSSSDDEQSRFHLTPTGEESTLDELQLESGEDSERILRGTYEWGITETSSFESGAEIALNSVERSIRLLEDGGNGNLVEVPLFNQASTVEETRIEAFTTYTRQAGEKLLIEGSVDLEASELAQEGGDVRRSRDFFFVRPRFVVRYDLDEQTQLRARVERSVEQLDFGAFTASFTNDDNRSDVIVAGNPELVPEKSWDYEVTYERRLREDAGFVSVTGTIRDVEDLQARIPLLIRNPDGELEVRTAPGNVGDGMVVELEVTASVRLGWLNLDGAVLDASVELTESRVTDPFTGEERDFDGVSPYEWRLGFRHDTDWRGLSYGFSTGNEGPSEEFDLDYRQKGERDVDVEVFAEFRPLGNLTVRLEAEELLRAERERERLEFVGLRADGVLERRELRSSEPAREITLSVQGVF